MSITIAYIIGAVLAFIATVLACVLVMPKKRLQEFKENKFLVWLHNIINFKSLLIEKILKVLYVFFTAACVFTGFFMLFSKMGYRTSAAPMGLLVMILGPVLVRLIFEASMLFVINTKNVVEINNKMGDGKGDDPEIL